MPRTYGDQRQLSPLKDALELTPLRGVSPFFSQSM